MDESEKQEMAENGSAEPRSSEVECGAEVQADDAGPETIEALSEELGRIRVELAKAKLEHEIERAALVQGAVDVEAVGLVIRQRLEAAPAQTVGAVTEALKREKPRLFGSSPQVGEDTRERRATGRASTGAARGDMDQAESARRRAAWVAAQTGDRQALLMYMKLRREGAD